MITELTKEQKKALRSAAEKGMANATKSLSQLVESKIVVETAMVDFLPVSEIPKRVGGPETLSMGIYLRMMGDVGGTSLLMLSRDSALSLVDILYERDRGTTQILNQDDRSALGEIGNVLTASYLTELGNLLKVSLYHSPPCIVFDVANSLIGFVLRGMNSNVSNVLVTQIKFKGNKGEIGGDFIFLLDSSSLSVLVNKIDKRLHPT
jgi:chemotaxis protein CheC